MNELQQDYVKRHLAGDPLAGEWLYEQYAPRVLAYLLRCGFPRGSAQDLVQETFLNVFRFLRTYDATRGPLGPWIATIARNMANRHWKKHAKDANFDTQLAEDVFACEDHPGNDLHKQEQMISLEDCVDDLPAELARLIRLRFIQSKTTRGMALELGLAESTVRARLEHAMHQLEQCMQSKGFDGKN